MAIRFSQALTNMGESDIGMLLKLTEQPEMISFAGGLPAPETFPLKELREARSKVLMEDGIGALQYGPSKGYMRLRELIAERMNRHSQTSVTAEDILVTAGSQQALDILGRVFLDKDDVVLIESPSYLGAINAFALQQPRFVEVPTDEKGIVPDELEKILMEEKNIKMIYVIPDFHNPTGITWSYARRKEFMEVINKYEIPVLEDNPYGELRYEGESLPSLKSLDTKGLVVFLGTFSKTLCPGMRLGWMAAAEPIMGKADVVKQGTDLGTSSSTQREVAEYIQSNDFDLHVRENAKLYRHRRDLMLAAMKKFFPENVAFTHPEGGLFTWVCLPETLNARNILYECIKEKVAFVPGDGFYPVTRKQNYFRLNYSNMDEEKIIEGIRRIGKVLNKEC